jgi:hypothetical protein
MPTEREPTAGRHRFTGHIAGVGTAGGTRMVLGAWSRTPHGPFADVMVAHPDGTRELIAPDQWVADFVSATYTFDRIRIAPVRVDAGDSPPGASPGARWSVRAGPLDWTFDVGSRRPLGWALRGIPRKLGTSLAFARVTDRVAPWILPGVRTLGTAGNGRTEWYAATDLHAIRDSVGSWAGRTLGAMTPVDPAPDFGFGSTPREPSLTSLTSTVVVP